MRVHLVDGTYELFRAYFGAPEARDKSGAERGAVQGLLRSLEALLRGIDDLVELPSGVLPDVLRPREIAGLKHRQPAAILAFRLAADANGRARVRGPAEQ